MEPSRITRSTSSTTDWITPAVPPPDSTSRPTKARPSPAAATGTPAATSQRTSRATPATVSPRARNSIDPATPVRATGRAHPLTARLIVPRHSAGDQGRTHPDPDQHGIGSASAPARARGDPGARRTRRQDAEHHARHPAAGQERPDRRSPGERPRRPGRRPSAAAGTEQQHGAVAESPNISRTSRQGQTGRDVATRRAPSEVSTSRSKVRPAVPPGSRGRLDPGRCLHRHRRRADLVQAGSQACQLHLGVHPARAARPSRRTAAPRRRPGRSARSGRRRAGPLHHPRLPHPEQCLRQTGLGGDEDHPAHTLRAESVATAPPSRSPRPPRLLRRAPPTPGRRPPRERRSRRWRAGAGDRAAQQARSVVRQRGPQPRLGHPQPLGGRTPSSTRRAEG